MHFRFATPSDAPQLALLRWHSRDVAERRREPLDAFGSRFATWLSGAIPSGAWHASVAEDQSHLLGCMYLRLVETVPVPGLKSRAWGYITHAYVTEPVRNRGIGGRLLSLLVDRARELGLHELHVWPSIRAISMYVRAGFLSPESQRVGTSPDEPSYLLPLRDMQNEA